ncbi:MAG: hypothetical protein KGV50_06320, partial [Gammaproteobacteria bacterium]|nr:hypothetical protein [Gammaproteobacteria bacterium]
MADVKKCFAPSDKSITKVIKSCKEGFAVYPARLALTTETLKSTSQSTEALEMPPQTIAQAEKSKQYDLRRLRDGFIYILATRAKGMMTAHAPNNKAWYVYCYRSPDVDAKSEDNLPMDYHFNQYKCGELNVYKDWKLECDPKPFIHLPEQIENIEILYSDYKLPPEFLDKLAADPNDIDGTRGRWMRKANIAEPKDAAAPITELKKLIKDFSTSVKVVNEPSKALRFTPIGFRKKCDNIANQIIFHKKGAVIALDDTIGTARDLAAYHQYLEEQRQIKLKKYEYAITTAQFIDAYAKQVYTKKWDNWKGILDAANQPLKEFSRTNMLPPVGPQMSPERIKKREPTLEKIYLKDVKGIAPQHLDKSNKADDNIIKALKKEFELDDIPGLNTVHKMANLSGLHGKSFLNIATVHARFAESNIQRLKDLSDLIEKLSNSEKVGSSANGFLHHFHGLIWGLNQTTYGRKGLLLSLDPKTELVSKEDKTLLKQMIDSLSGVVKTFTSVSGILAGASNLAALNLYSYDLVIELLVTEITSIPLKRKAGKTLVWEETEVVEHIRETYRTKGIEENKEYIEEILSHNENTKTHKVRGRPHYERAKFYKKAPKKEMHSKTTVEIDRQLVINDDYYHLFRNTSEKLTGAAMYFGLAGSFMSFFGENTAKTRAGKIANDPILNTM